VAFLEMDADRALFYGKIQGLVVAFHENERPLGGLIGLLDWRFHGAISYCVRAGAISGKSGECTYMPFERNGRVYHIFLAGAGPLPASGKRAVLPEPILKNLAKNIAALRLQDIGVSSSDFGGLSEDTLTKQLKGVPLWIVP